MQNQPESRFVEIVTMSDEPMSANTTQQYMQARVGLFEV